MATYMLLEAPDPHNSRPWGFAVGSWVIASNIVLAEARGRICRAEL
jgi:hypothetical protein